MITTGLHEDLHNFLADLWNSGEETGGNSRFYRPLSCWLESCTYEELPAYMKQEYDRGRILIYPLFPKRASEDMGYARKESLLQNKQPQEAVTTKRRWLRTIENFFETGRRNDNHGRNTH